VSKIPAKDGGQDLRKNRFLTMDEEEEIVKRIEDFLDGNLDESEKLAFLDQCKKDSALAQNLILHEQIRKAIQSKERVLLKSHFDELDARTRRGDWKDNAKRRYLWPVAIAASVLLLSVSIFVILSLNSKTYETIYETYYKPFPGQLISESVRGEVKDQTGNLARTAYEARDYRTAELRLKKLVEDHPDESHIKLYLAICYLEMNEIEKSKDLLNILDDPENAFQLEAKWYLALLNIKIKKRTEAVKYLRALAEGRGEYAKEARLILGDLDAVEN
jgi:predicted Zn-dependent protease